MMYEDVSKAIDFGTGILAGEAADETAWQEDGLPASVVGIRSSWPAYISPSGCCGSTLHSRYRYKTLALMKRSERRSIGAAQT